MATFALSKTVLETDQGSSPSNIFYAKHYPLNQSGCELHPPQTPKKPNYPFNLSSSTISLCTVYSVHIVLKVAKTPTNNGRHLCFTYFLHEMMMMMTYFHSFGNKNHTKLNQGMLIPYSRVYNYLRNHINYTCVKNLRLLTTVAIAVYALFDAHR